MSAPAPSAARSRAWPAAAWALVILALTSVPGRDLPEVHVSHVDKAVHVTIYGVFAALVTRALAGGRPMRTLAGVVAFTSLFGAADEWHQQFIPGRSQDRYDWLADTAGASLGVLLLTAATARRESIR